MNSYAKKWLISPMPIINMKADFFECEPHHTQNISCAYYCFSLSSRLHRLIADTLHSIVLVTGSSSEIYIYNVVTCTVIFIIGLIRAGLSPACCAYGLARAQARV